MDIIQEAADLRIYNIKKREFYDEKAIVLTDKNSGKVIGVGVNCLDAMDHMAINDGVLSAPIRLGRIEDFKAAEFLFKYFFRHYAGGRFGGFKGNAAIISQLSWSLR